MLFQDGDKVEVRRSKQGYTGPGEIVSVAYGSTFLVKVEIEEKPTVILVRLTEMIHSKKGDKSDGVRKLR